jgi:hypothetical protein
MGLVSVETELVVKQDLDEKMVLMEQEVLMTLMILT